MGGSGLGGLWPPPPPSLRPQDVLLERDPASSGDGSHEFNGEDVPGLDLPKGRFAVALPARTEQGPTVVSRPPKIMPEGVQVLGKPMLRKVAASSLIDFPSLHAGPVRRWSGQKGAACVLPDLQH